LSKLCALRDELNAIPRPPSIGLVKRESSKPHFEEAKAMIEKPKHSKEYQSSFTKTKIAKLATDINSLKDDFHVLSILEYFGKI
jgi:hypothetical protein